MGAVRADALPKAIRMVVLSLVLVAVFFVTNLVYHVLHKPTEVFSPVSSGFNKTPIETWRAYAPLFREYSTASISPELLARIRAASAPAWRCSR
jgi:hypothetical protein